MNGGADETGGWLKDAAAAHLDERAVLLGLVAILTIILFRSVRRLRVKAVSLRLKDEELDVYLRAMEAHAMVNMSASDGTITYVNDTMAEATGYTSDELVGRRFKDVLLADSRESAKNLPATLQAGQTWSGETKIRRKDGSILWTRSTIVPFLDSSGNLLRTISLRTDITESKLLQAEFQDRAMLDRLRDEVYVISPETLGLVYLNKRALEKMGWTADAIAGKKLADVSDPFDEAAFRARVAPLIAGEVESVLYESTTFGTPVEVGLQLEHSLDGTPRFVAVVRDVSERKRSERERAEFVSTVSHELRSPLTSIKGSLNLIDSGALGPLHEKAGALIKVAIRNVDRLVRLVNDLLDLEKLDADMMLLSVEPVDLIAFADDAIAANAGYGHEFGVNLRFRGSKQPVYAMVSRDGMMQVLTNLISNAVKFSPPGQVVDIRVAELPDCVRLLVTDRGGGIPPEAQKILFTRFAQAHNQGDPRHAGTGLGLSIAKSIVEKHYGTLSFINEPGGGTTFVIELPKVDRLRAVA